MKIWYNVFFIFEILGRMHKNKIFFNIFFAMFWRKPSILILNLYLYGIKIQINIKKIDRKIRGKITNFLKGFFDFLGLGRTRPNAFGPDLVRPSKQWKNLHCSYSTWTIESELIHSPLFTCRTVEVAHTEGEKREK